VLFLIWWFYFVLVYGFGVLVPTHRFACGFEVDPEVTYLFFIAYFLGLDRLVLLIMCLYVRQRVLVSAVCESC